MSPRAPAPPGRFITFEGGEGVGKTTQIARLAERLRAEGTEVVTTREPGGSPKAERLRAALLSGRAAPYGPLGEAVLFTAARIDHLDALIKPALARGACVLCDRFADSTRAYQGALGQVDPRMIAMLERVALGGLRPDLTIILDAPFRVGLERAAGRRGDGGEADRFEAENENFHEGVRRAFLDIASAEPDRCCVVNASLPEDEVARAIWQLVESRFVAKSPAKAAAVAR